MDTPSGRLSPNSWTESKLAQLPQTANHSLREDRAKWDPQGSATLKEVLKGLAATSGKWMTTDPIGTLQKFIDAAIPPGVRKPRSKWGRVS